MGNRATNRKDFYMIRLIGMLLIMMLLSVSAVAAQPVITNSPPPVVSNSAPPVVRDSAPPAVNSNTPASTIIQQNSAQQPRQDMAAGAEQLAPVTISQVDRVFASWQPFTGGVMMWWSDTRQIWVMTNADGVIRVYNDIWREGMPYPTAQAPSGRFTPIMGFGAIWQLIGGGNSPLGWAMSEHVGYDSAGRRTLGSEWLIQGPGDTLYAVSISPGANVGTWRVISYG
jgi:hypothetical protein